MFCFMHWAPCGMAKKRKVEHKERFQWCYIKVDIFSFVCLFGIYYGTGDIEVHSVWPNNMCQYFCLEWTVGLLWAFCLLSFQLYYNILDLLCCCSLPYNHFNNWTRIVEEIFYLKLCRLVLDYCFRFTI